jgi:methionyl-tRNA formyltransferase
MSPVKLAAVKNNIPVYQPVKIRSQETLEQIRSHNADVAVVVAYGRILPPAILNSFPKGAINVHFSLLPKYRGAAPVNWAIVNGESETGVTTMYMDEGLDTGDILLTSKRTIGGDENSVELMAKLAEDGAVLMSKTLETLESIIPTPQNDAEATLAPMLNKDLGKINWAEPAANTARKVRGFQPFPTSFTTFRDKRLTIWKAKPVETDSIEGIEADQPGAIVKITKESIYVACGNETVLELIELQPEGKKRVAARDMINAAKPAVGEVMG